MMFISFGLLLFCFLPGLLYGKKLDRIEDTIQRPSFNKDIKEVHGDYDDYIAGTTVSSEEFEETKEAKEVTFHLYTRQNPTTSQDIFIDDVETLNDTNFNENWPTRIIIHGWQNNKDSRMNSLITSAYLAKGDFNVIIVHWGAITRNLNYLHVTKAVSLIGQSVAELTMFLNRERNVSFDDIYLIGHSLGAHVAGFAGKFISPNKYNTIFALDAAKPQFENRNTTDRLHSDDAKYVESIHTSIIDVGFRIPLGHASFYPNYSRLQKGCFTVFCNHYRAYEFFAESINSNKGFYGKQCESFMDIIYRNCTRQDSDDETANDYIMQKMGGEPSIPKEGIFYLPTRSRRPFALGIFN